MGKRAKKKAAAERKKKAVTIEPIDRNPEDGTQTPHCYRILDFLIREHHDHLADADIAIAYQMSALREDVDGTKGFGRVKRGNDLDRAYADFDFVIIIPHELWQNSDSDRRHAIIDFHLCCCGVTKDVHGEPVIDEKDRNVYRLRKAIRVFPENTRRYGFWQNDAVADAFKRFKDRDRPLLTEDREMGRGIDEPATGPLPGDEKPAKGKSAKGKAADGNGHADSSAVSLGALKLDAAIEQALTGEGLDNLGALLEYERQHDGDFKAIAGLTVSRRSQLKQKLADYLILHPEFLPEREGATT